MLRQLNPISNIYQPNKCLPKTTNDDIILTKQRAKHIAIIIKTIYFTMLLRYGFTTHKSAFILGIFEMAANIK